MYELVTLFEFLVTSISLSFINMNVTTLYLGLNLGSTDMVPWVRF